MIQLLFNILAAACLSYLLVVAEPIVALRNYLRLTDATWVGRLLGCALCSGFWVGLAVTHSVLDAAIVGVVAEVIYRRMQTIPIKDED